MEPKILSAIQYNVFMHNELEQSKVTLETVVVGIERLMKTYSKNPSFSNHKNLEEIEQQLDEVCNLLTAKTHL